METHHDSDEALIAVADEIAGLAIDCLRDGMGLDDALKPMRYELAVPMSDLHARLGGEMARRLLDDPVFPFCPEEAVEDFFRNHGLELAAFREALLKAVTLRVGVLQIASGPPDPWW